jgi:hypothetical protein
MRTTLPVDPSRDALVGRARVDQRRTLRAAASFPDPFFGPGGHDVGRRLLAGVNPFGAAKSTGNQKKSRMAYVIAEPCIRTTDLSCVEVCPG